MIKRICKIIATFGPIGEMLAPGTIASLMALPLVYFLLNFLAFNIYKYVAAIAVLYVVAYYIIYFAKELLDIKNDQESIIIDEFIGAMCIFIGLPYSPQTAIFGIICFRLLDISKILGIHYIERIGGIHSIILDDIAAALITNMILRFLLV